MIALADIIGKDGASKSVHPVPSDTILGLGYKFSDRNLTANNGDNKTIIHEVVDADTKRCASFSFLYSSKDKKGIVLPRTFEHYLSVFSRKMLEESNRSEKAS